jgi:hypothetical protein
MDYQLWKLGENVANNPVLGKAKHPIPWELDFLRGMHQKVALSLLAQYLQISTGRNVRLMSIWLDKTAWVSWTDPNGKLVKRRELADLAVVVRKQSGRTIDRWMWLVQGKRTHQLLDTYTGTSSPHEIDLLQRMPTFSMQGVTKPFALANECTSGKVVPWTFVDFDADISAPNSAYIKGYSPIAPRWLGAVGLQPTWGPAWQTAPATPRSYINSYCECLKAIVLEHNIAWIDSYSPPQKTPVFRPGAPINKIKFPDWWRLYAELIYGFRTTTTKHAQTQNNPKGSVIQFSRIISNAMIALYNNSFWQGHRYLDVVHGYGDGSQFEDIPFDIQPENMCWAVAATPHAYGGRGVINQLSSFNNLLMAEESDIPPTNDGPPMSNDDGDDEPGGMQVTFVDVLGDEE